MKRHVKTSGETESAPRPRGRPRSSAARRAILKAAKQLLAEGGLTYVTMERLAERAGVGKPTIYRSWPNSHAVAMAAIMDAAPLASGELATAPLEALRAQLRQIAGVFSSRAGRNVALMIAAAESETEIAKAFRHHFILARRSEGKGLLSAAIARGELRGDLDLEVTLDLIYAPLFYRLLVGHGQLDEAFTDAVIDHALQGLRRS